MAAEDQDEQMEELEAMAPSFPTGRIKKIIKLDKDINKLTSEAQLLISCSAELFLEFLAERSLEVASENKRKTIKLQDLRTAVKKHRATSDFLLDELPVYPQPSDRATTRKGKEKVVNGKSEPVLPRNTRRIDRFFRKPEAGTSNCEREPENGPSNFANESDNRVKDLENGTSNCVKESDDGSPASANESGNETFVPAKESENGA